MKKVLVLMAVLFSAIAVTAKINLNADKADKVQSENQADATTAATPKATETMTAEEFVAYLEKCGKYFLATVDGDQPKIRPFSFCAAIDGKVYFMTRKNKDVYKQLVANPKVQIAAYNEEGKREWMRITCKLVEEETPKIRTTFLDKYPQMKKAHPLDDPNYAFMKLVGITGELGKKVYTVK